MGYLVDYLERRGYVVRVPDPQDARAWLVRLTERGRNVDRRARATIRQVEREWAERLGERRVRQLHEALRDLAAYLEGRG